MKLAAMALAAIGMVFAPDPPAAPTGLAATPGANQVALDWADNSPAVAGYNVYRAGAAGGTYSKINSSLLTASAFTDTNATNGTPYFYVVTAVNSAQEESANSTEVPGTANGSDTTAPPIPVISSPSRRTKDSTPSTSGTAEPYSTVRLYVGLTEIGSTSAAANGTWTVANPSSLGADGVYSIKARATDGASNESGDSVAIAITLDTTAPAPPTNIRTTAYHNCVDVEWTASVSSDVAGYKVERKTASGNWGLLNSNLVFGTKYRDATPSNGTTYFYRVFAVDSAVEN